MSRYFELDILRGLAVLLMIIYHLFFDVLFFFNFPLFGFSPSYLGWKIAAWIIASTFLMLVGISLVISWNRHKRTESVKKLYLRFLKKGLLVFGLGIVITLVTAVVTPGWTVWFGILHLIGISIVLSLPFISFRHVAILGIIVWFLGLQFNVPPIRGATLDYYPLIPWWGTVLLGIAAGQQWYTDGKRNWKMPKELQKLLHRNFVKPILWVGRHSLLLYFIHQPIILLCLLIVKAFWNFRF